MSGRNAQKRISARAKRVFVRAVQAGARLEAAAATAGHSLDGFYGLRSRDSLFKRRWAAAMQSSGEAERAIVRGNNRRRLQRRRMRHLRFDTGRQEAFLNHFAGCGDAREAAEVAGVDHSTVYKHRRKDPVFAAAFDEALEQCYARLEVEAVRQRLQAQKRLARALDEGVVTGEVAKEFDRVMRLLDRWDRRNGRIGIRQVAPEKRQALSFDEAMGLLESKLRNLDIPILRLPPDIAARYDGDGGGGSDGDGDGGT